MELQHPTLVNFLESMEIIIENFLKNPTLKSYEELHHHTYLQVMSSFYLPEFSKHIYDSIKNV